MDIAAEVPPAASATAQVAELARFSCSLVNPRHAWRRRNNRHRQQHTKIERTVLQRSIDINQPAYQKKLADRAIS
jgi:hypothetical protein